MKKFDLNAYGVEEMGLDEMSAVDGGVFPLLICMGFALIFTAKE